MHAQTIIVAAVALLSSNVIAQDRPKFYFPRQVKREISNTTSNSVEDTSSSSTKRDIIGDLLGVLTGGSAPATASPVKSIAPVKSVVDVAPGVVKTVIVSNTVVVNNGVTTTLPPSSPSSSAAGTTASKVSSVKPPLIVLPTLSLDLPSVLDPILPTKSSADGITGPSGILGSSGAVGPAPTGSTPSGVTYSGTGTGVSSSTDLDYQTLSASSSPSGGGILSSILSGLNPDPTSTSTGAGTGTGTGATTTFAPSSSTATPSSSSTGLESMISSIISSGTAGTGSTLFPTQSGTNSTTHRVPPVPTGGDTTSHRGNGTAIVLPPTTTKKPTKPTSLTDIPTTIITTSAEAAPTTSDWVGSSILIQTTQSGEKATTTTAVPSGIPSSLPLVVAPINGVPPAMDGFTLIQVGFTYALNYEFVVANSMSSAQIFSYLPKGIAYGLEIKDRDVVMHSLQPFDTSGTLGYITTLALAYIPDDKVSNLGIMIHVPVSRLYKNPSEPVAVIMSSINPAISITVGSGLDGSNPKAPVGGGGGDGSTPTPDDKDSGNGNGGIFDDNENNQTPGAKGMTAGIATGAVVAAAAYGAAMFFIARRYKRRKLSHRRARSVMNPAEMAEASGSAALPGGVYMSGGRQSTGSGESGSGSSAGNSARTAQISAPMMAENSLGWN
ncbi:hypothetical protein V493_04249 [Pseudogymnoascus sp. VKM F-4281 (FW-2241)]|nr:hypothetical protein V493_04249 [Pseudogymnoascus sp. VKM F-4281 (FW-2241)]